MKKDYKDLGASSLWPANLVARRGETNRGDLLLTRSSFLHTKIMLFLSNVEARLSSEPIANSFLFN